MGHENSYLQVFCDITPEFAPQAVTQIQMNQDTLKVPQPVAQFPAALLQAIPWGRILPEKLHSALPTIEEIEAELQKEEPDSKQGDY